MAMSDDLPGRLKRYRLLAAGQGQEFLAIGFKLLGGWFLAFAGWPQWLQPPQQISLFRQIRLPGNAQRLSVLNIPADRLSIQGQRFGDGTNGVSAVPAADNLINIHNTLRVIAHVLSDFLRVHR